MAGLGRLLAEAVTGCFGGGTPAEAADEAKRRVLDSIGCMMGGRTGESSRIVLDYVRSQGARPLATVVGESERTSLALAAFANGALIRYLDFQDSSSTGTDPGHPSGVMAGLLALAEATGATGSALTEAIVFAYEAMGRLQRCVRGEGMVARGFHNATLLGAGVPVGAARLLGLDPDRTADALAISLTHAPTLDQLRHGQIPNSKGVADGWVVSAAVTATLLAAQGLRGPEEVLEGRWGFGRAVAGEMDVEALLGPLDRPAILLSGMKRFPCVGSAQSAVAAILDLRARGLRAENASAIEVWLPARLYEALAADPDKFAPTTKEAADHSLPYCAAVALTDGELTPTQFATERLASPQIRQLMGRITLRHAEEYDSLPAGAGPTRVSIRTGDGACHEAEVLWSPGGPGNPLTAADLSSKFHALCRGAIPQGRAAEIETAVGELERLEDVRRLTALLRW